MLPNYSLDRNSNCIGGSMGAFANCSAHSWSVLRIDYCELEGEKEEVRPDYFKCSEVWKGIKRGLREAGRLWGWELFIGKRPEEGSHHQTRGSNSSFPNGLVNKVRTLGGGSGKGPESESQATEVRTTVAGPQLWERSQGREQLLIPSTPASRALFYSVNLMSQIWSQGP